MSAFAARLLGPAIVPHEAVSPSACSRYELGVREEQQEEQVLLALYLRERSHYRDYSSGSSSYGTTLFGHPLLLSVPRSCCSQEALYNLFLQRLA